MLKLALVYAHLLATCVAVAWVVSADLSVMAKLVGYRVVVPPPGRGQTRVIALALLVLCATGAGLVALGLQERADYLANGKLQGKLLLVLALLLNALVLHGAVFPLLASGRPVRRWRAADVRLVSLTAGLSTVAWFFAAFLGVARSWNFVKGWYEVLLVVLVLWALTALVVRLLLAFARIEVLADGRRHRRHAVKDTVIRLLMRGGVPVAGPSSFDEAKAAVDRRERARRPTARMRAARDAGGRERGRGSRSQRSLTVALAVRAAPVAPVNTVACASP